MASRLPGIPLLEEEDAVRFVSSEVECWESLLRPTMTPAIDTQFGEALPQLRRGQRLLGAPSAPR